MLLKSPGFTVAAGKLTAITDAAGEAWAYQYDAAGRLTQTTDPTARDVVLTSPDGLIAKGDREETVTR